MRSPDKGKDLEQLERVIVEPLDVTDVTSVKAAVTQCVDKFGGIDVLVNNAGYGSNALFEQSPDESIRAMYDTNVFGVMNTMKAVLPHMRKQGSGCIINVTSMAGLLGLPGNGVYASSKFAVEGLSESLALEYRPLGIRVMTVAPGAFRTTAFMDNIENHVDDGDAQLKEHSKRLRDHFAALAHGGAAQDPQIVADKIFECATADMPVHNPVGADADGLAALIDGSETRQAFIDIIAQRFLP
eukprot:s1_g2276.t1